MKKPKPVNKFSLSIRITDPYLCMKLQRISATMRVPVSAVVKQNLNRSFNQIIIEDTLRHLVDNCITERIEKIVSEAVADAVAAGLQAAEMRKPISQGNGHVTSDDSCRA